MATSVGTGSGVLSSYIPDLADTANIQTALKQLYYGTTGGTLDQTKGVYGGLYTLYTGNPTLAGNVAITGTLGVTANTTLTGDLAVNGGDITSTSATLNIGQTATTTSTINLGTAVNASGVTKTLNIGTGGNTGSTTNINIGAGTTYQSSTINLKGKVVFQAGLSASPTVGVIENDSDSFYGTTAALGQRGIIPISFYYSTNSSNTLTGGTGNTQSIFGTSGPANGILLEAGYSYEVEIFIAGTCSGTNSVSLQFLSAITGTQALYSSAFKSTTVAPPLEGRAITSTVAASTITSASNGTNFMAIILGKMSITTDTLWLPQIGFSASPGTSISTNAGTYVKVTPIGANATPLNVGGWT